MAAGGRSYKEVVLQNTNQPQIRVKGEECKKKETEDKEERKHERTRVVYGKSMEILYQN